MVLTATRITAANSPLDAIPSSDEIRDRLNAYAAEARLLRSLYRIARKAEAIKKAVNSPVIGIGGIKTPEVADNIIRKRNVDLVAVGRSLLHNPLWGFEAIKTLQKR